jgi:hypothetical protein
MTPEEALDHVRSIRPRVLLAPSQWHVWMLPFLLHSIQIYYYKLTGSETFHV